MSLINFLKNKLKIGGSSGLKTRSETNYIIVHHTATNRDVSTWQNIAEYHKRLGWNDIGYHYGIVYDKQENGQAAWKIASGRDEEAVGAHAKGVNAYTIGVVFEGNFEKAKLPQEAFDLGVTLLTELCINYNLDESRIMGHKEIPASTLCPGLFFPINQLRGAVRDSLNIFKHNESSVKS